MTRHAAIAITCFLVGCSLAPLWTTDPYLDEVWRASQERGTSIDNFIGRCEDGEFVFISDRWILNHDNPQYYIMRYSWPRRLWDAVKP